jgi:hypothetical protein
MKLSDIFEEIETSYRGYNYKKGYCDAYAIALGRFLGKELYVVRGYYTDLDGERTYEDCHAVVKIKDGYYQDVTGERKEEELKNECLFNNKIEEIEIEPISEEELRYAFTSEGVSDSEIEIATEFIKSKMLKNEDTKKDPVSLLKTLGEEEITDISNEIDATSDNIYPARIKEEIKKKLLKLYRIPVKNIVIFIPLDKRIENLDAFNKDITRENVDEYIKKFNDTQYYQDFKEKTFLEHKLTPSLLITYNGKTRLITGDRELLRLALETNNGLVPVIEIKIEKNTVSK